MILFFPDASVDHVLVKYAILLNFNSSRQLVDIIITVIDKAKQIYNKLLIQKCNFSSFLLNKVTYGNYIVKPSGLLYVKFIGAVL